MAEPVAELNPLDDLGQAFLAVEFAPLLLAGRFGIESDDIASVRLIVAADMLWPACEDEEEIDWQVANLMADLEATANEMKAALKALAKLPVDG